MSAQIVVTVEYVREDGAVITQRAAVRKEGRFFAKGRMVTEARRKASAAITQVTGVREGTTVTPA
jgi:hypothetical protein